jgi:rhodanese-related sulfurtransferase
MKKLSILFGLTMLLFFTACKDKSVAQEIKILSPQEFSTATAGNNIQLIDVRTSKEFEEGHLDNALNIDVLKDDFASQVKKLNVDKPIYLYCRSGKRSANAASILKNLGFTDINDMEGGYLKWESENFQIKN